MAGDMDINRWVFLLAIIDIYIDVMSKAGNFDLVNQARELRKLVVDGDICK